MIPGSRSPIPFLTALAGLGLGGVVGAAIGAALCRECELEAFDYFWGGALFGGLVGALLGAVAGVHALRSGPLGRVVAVGAVALVFAGGAGAWAATELWQGGHPVSFLERPHLCREPPRPRWCGGPRGRPRVVDIGASNEIPPGVAVGGGLVVGAAGATLGAFAEAALLRRRTAG